MDAETYIGCAVGAKFIGSLDSEQRKKMTIIKKKTSSPHHFGRNGRTLNIILFFGGPNILYFGVSHNSRSAPLAPFDRVLKGIE